MQHNSLIIKFDLIDKLEISISDFLYLCNIYFDSLDIPYNDVDRLKLQEKKFIKINEELNKTILRQKSIDLIEDLCVDTNFSVKNKLTIKKSKRHINQEIESRIGEFRHKWKGTKGGAMGDAKACKQKLTRWMKENPEYSFDDILKAADMYLQSLNDFRFVTRADYFIYKQNVNKEETSMLSAFIDEINDYVEQEWTSNLN